MRIYVVETGDSIDSIAEMYDVDVDSVIYDNQIEYPYRLAVGQSLIIRGGTVRDRRTLVSNGYAYPFIDSEVLEQTLPFLSELSVFSYGFTAEGDLVPPQLDDVWMIEAALRHQALPILTLTPIGIDGKFNNNLISILVNDINIQQRLIWQLGQVMQEKGYQGIDLDFEYILAKDRDAYVRFVQNVTSVMNAFNYQVSVALAPKTSGDQEGLLYEGMDYQGLGAAANRVLLMTYEWGYTYGPPMAVAPINMVRRVVDYAVSVIPRDKISLGIPNYGYDWPLPFVKGVTKANTIGNVEAVQMAVFYGVPIQFDEAAMSPFFRYWQYGIEHEVWFEDARSIQAKFSLIKEYGLHGAGYWQLMRLFRANWLLMADRFQIVKQ